MSAFTSTRSWLASRLAATEDEHGEQHEHDVTGRRLREVFLERAISLRTMDPRLRFVTGLALLQIVIAAVLVGLRDAHFPTVGLDATEGQQTVMPKVTFWLVVVFIALAWSYLLCGLLHGHRLVRLGALGVFGWGAWELWNEPFPLGTPRMIPSYVLVAGICLVGLHALRESPDEKGGPRRLRLATFPVLFVLVLGLYLAFWWRLREFQEPRFFTLAFYHQFEVLSFALIPVLFMAGVDFADWGDVVAGRASALLARFRSPLPLAVATALVAAGVLAYFIDTTAGARFGRGFGLAALFAAVVFVAASSLGGRRVLGRVPYAAVFVSALVLFGLVIGVAYLVSTQTAEEVAAAATIEFKHPAPPRFQLGYPAFWQERELHAKGGVKLFFFVAPAESAQFFVFYIPKSVAAGVPDLRSLIFKGRATSRRRDGPWQLTVFRLGTKEGRAWQRTDHGSVWLLAGITQKAAAAAYAPFFERVATSWTTKVTPFAEKSAAVNTGAVTLRDRVVEIAALSWFAIALVAGTLLVTHRGFSRPDWLLASGVFFVVAGVFFALVQLPTVGFTFGLGRNALPSLSLAAIECFVAVGTLAALVWLAVTRRLTASFTEPLALLFLVNVALIAIQLLDKAIASGRHSGNQFSIAQAVLVLVALVWDIVMSGEAITNRHNRHFPRHTRVFVYLGYITAVATAVLFFSSFHFQTTNHLLEPQFESEALVEDGLIFLGSALVIALFVLRLVRYRSRAAL